jgi:alkylated DNA repair dioxygenase AlkB
MPQALSIYAHPTVSMRQEQLFAITSYPEGFLYEPDFLTEAEESKLLREIRTLNFEVFDFHGYKAKRRIVAYGWDYDFSSRRTTETKPIADFLLPLRDRAATFISNPPESIVEAVVIEYTPGAPIGWHRDVPQFETIIGISLAGSCRMRLKPYKAEGKITSINLAPRSIYVISGIARWRYQHSIPPVESLRYSITFRTLREQEKMKAG